MRFVLSCVLLPLIASSATAADDNLTTRVEAVTVFLSGAEVTRIGKIKLEKGEHAVTIVDVPASAVPGSIRVEGKATGKLEIVSVDTRRAFLARAEAQAADKERKGLEDEIEALRDQKAAAESQAHAAETQKALIGNLAQLPSRPAPASGPSGQEDWPRILSTISQGSEDASRRLIDAQAKLRDLERRIEEAENKLSTLAPAKSEQTEVTAHVEAGSPLEVEFTVRYQVANAGWTPLYDARLQTGSKTVAPKLDLARRAAISQKSGETWDNASLQLSTARPSAGAAAPELATQTVDFEQEVKPVPMAVAKAKREDRTRGEAGEYEAARDGVPGGGMSAPAAAPAPEATPIEERPAEVTIAPFEATFAVPGRVTVPGTGIAKRVALSTEQIEPALTCRTVPKLDPHAYLYARLTFPKGTPLLPGQVYLFRDGTFVGTGSLPLLPPGDGYDLGFGLDDQVKVRHAVLEETRGETGLISSSHTDVRNFRVTVKNMHERPISLVVMDQVPVSLNQDIKIDYTGKALPTKTNVEDKRGVMNFEAKLETDEEKVFEYGYRITWPAAKSIQYR